MAKIALLVAATALVLAASSSAAGNADRKEIDERLRQLKSDTNEIDHGTHDDVAAAKGDGKNGLLGHWGEQQEWQKLGPKKQRKIKYGRRGHKRRNKPRKNPHDLDDPRLQDLGFDLPADKTETTVAASDPSDIPERPRNKGKGRAKPRKFMKKKKNKNQLKLAEKESMRRALEKGMPAEKVLETMKREGKFRNRFYKKFVKKYERKLAKKGAAAAAAAKPPAATP